MDYYSVIGNPIQQSLSPQIHRLFAEQTHQVLTYTAIQVESGQLAATLGDLQSRQWRGLNITAPLKELAYPLADSLSPRATLAKAINTIHFQPDGTRFGDNTDGVGLIRDITLNQNVSLKNKAILVLGAGGAVRGVLPAILAEDPSQVVIANRTPEKAEQLASEFPSIKAIAWSALTTQSFDIVINGTSPATDFALPPKLLNSGAYCYDMVYGGDLTPFLRWARAQGCELYSDGLGMLVEQAAESFYIWRQIRPDTRPVLAFLRQIR